MHYVDYLATFHTVCRIPDPSSFEVHLSLVPVHPVVRSSIMSAVLSVSSLIEVWSNACPPAPMVATLVYFVGFIWVDGFLDKKDVG